MKYPSDVNYIYVLDVIDSLTHKTFDFVDEDKLKVALSKSLTCSKLQELEAKFVIDPLLRDVIYEFDSLPLRRFDVSYINLPISYTKLLSSLVQAPKLDLKSLPDHLKYAFLGEKESLPVIISSKLTALEEEKLIRVLR